MCSTSRGSVMSLTRDKRNRGGSWTRRKILWLTWCSVLIFLLLTTRLHHSIMCVSSECFPIPGLCSPSFVDFWWVEQIFSGMSNLLVGNTVLPSSCLNKKCQTGRELSSQDRDRTREYKRDLLCVGMDKGRGDRHGFCRHGAVAFAVYHFTHVFVWIETFKVRGKQGNNIVNILLLWSSDIGMKYDLDSSKPEDQLKMYSNNPDMGW